MSAAGQLYGRIAERTFSADVAEERIEPFDPAMLAADSEIDGAQFSANRVK
jgi:hypothetical protein